MAHQLPGGWQEGDRLDRLIPAPAHLREKDERLMHALQAASQLALRVAGTTVRVAGTAVGALADISVGLDPIVFGGVVHPEVPVVAWVALAQWEWQ
jgi:hypothetical protein